MNSVYWCLSTSSIQQELFLALRSKILRSWECSLKHILIQEKTTTIQGALRDRFLIKSDSLIPDRWDINHAIFKAGWAACSLHCIAGRTFSNLMQQQKVNAVWSCDQKSYCLLVFLLHTPECDNWSNIENVHFICWLCKLTRSKKEWW